MSSAAVFPINMIRLCIDGYMEDLSGRAYNKMLLVPLLFGGCGGLLLGMDDLFERVGYPQAFQARRTFEGPQKLRGSIRIPARILEDEEIGKQKGSFRTFDIIVQSRRQSGWQGLLMDPGRTHARKFRSEMELLHYICSDLEGFRVPHGPEEGFACGKQEYGSSGTAGESLPGDSPAGTGTAVTAGRGIPRGDRNRRTECHIK